jgi:hypothetical protein
VDIPIFREQDPTPEATVDRRAAHQHRELKSAAVQFVYDQRHLLGGRYQQRR